MIETKKNNWLKIRLLKLKPIYHTMVFEFNLQKLKFVLFGSLAVVVTLIIFFFPFESSTWYLPEEQADFLNYNLYGLIYFILFMVVAFFSGIICSDFKHKTGFITFPHIKKSYLLIGKFLTNFILVTGVIVIFYVTLTIICISFYGNILSGLNLSFNFAILYTLALAGFTTLFSSFLPSVLPVTIMVILVEFFGFTIISPFFVPNEPLWALSYLFHIVTAIVYPDFATRVRFSTWTQGTIVQRDWYFPTPEGAITSLLAYFFFSFILALYIFMRREKISFIRFRNMEDALIKKIKGIFNHYRT